MGAHPYGRVVRVLTLLFLLPSLALAQVVLNPSGGTAAGNGIRVVIGNTGQLQVIRLGTGQLYNPNDTPGATTNTSMDNGVFLAVGNTVVGPNNFAAAAGPGVTRQEWTAVSNTVTPSGQGGTAVTVLRATVGGRNYDLTTTWSYSYPNDFVTVTNSLVVPTGNTATVRLYHVADAYLAANDFGPSFFAAGPPTIVGGYRAEANIVEAWRYRSGVTWTGYFGGRYACLFNEASCPTGHINSVNSAVTFDNYVEATTVDNGFGIMWNFGASPGTRVTENDLTFYSFQPQLSKRFGASAIVLPATTTLTFTIDNVPGNLPQTGLGFTDAFPSGLRLANGTFTNTCGGSVTNAAGGALAANATSVRLSNGAMSSGTARCTLTVNVTASTAGTWINGRANISGLSVLENQVSDQTLAVVQGTPVVTVNTPGIINAGNAGAYPVTGTCQDSNGVVTVRVGTVQTTTPCSSNVYATTLQVSSLADGGAISVSGAQTNPAGTGTGTGTTSKDTVAPGAPVINQPANGTLTNNNTPTYTGTGEAGATIRVLQGSTEICTAVVSAGGTWSCTASTRPDGALSVTARATDPAGNTGGASPTRTITIDTTPPAAPVVTSPAQGAQVSPNPTISGTAEAQATVVVLQGGNQLCSTTANAQGQWSCATTLGIGNHTVSARQTDRAGNQGPTSGGRDFSIANVPSVTLNPPPPINAANASSYPVSGSCTAAVPTVTVQVGTLTTSATCTGANTFSTTVNASSLADSTQVTVVASQTNATGTGTDTRSTVKDTQAPPQPAITTPAEGAFTNTTTPTFTGTGEPGSTVVVSRAGTEVCRTVVPSTGTWACTATAQAPGTVQVTANATDAANNTSTNAPLRTFTIDVTAPGAPQVTAPSSGSSVAPLPSLSGTAEPHATLFVFEGNALVCSAVADASGNWSCPTALTTGPHAVVARQTDQAGNVSPDSPPHAFTVEGVPYVLLNTPADINGRNAQQYIVSGICTANGGAVNVSVGSVTASVPCANGLFSATLDVTAATDAAQVTVRAAQTTAAGTGADTRTVAKDSTAPTAPQVDLPVQDAVTTNNQPTVSGTAEPGSVIHVYIDGNLAGTTTANNQGQWSLAVPTPMADGTYELTVSATDFAGNESARSSPVTVTIDSIPPAAPVIVSPREKESFDEDRSFDINGVAEPGAQVDIYVDGTQVGSVTAGEDGRFSLPMDPAKLGVGTHVVQAVARDAAGNQGPSSAPTNFVVNLVESRFAGGGVVSCATAGGVEWLALAALLLRRRARAS